MKIIIAGSRYITDINVVLDAIKESPFRTRISQIVHGGCRGVDELAGEIATEQKISIMVFPADWDKYGKASGPIRNQKMSIYADGLIAIPGPQSKGTWDMIQKMQDQNKPVFIYKKLLKN